ncbi:MAG: hypothetical protein H7Y18_05205 [Clostridiaceae bacterium]|nr:hypothetical protein [Clostridiaceae bacterium]
MSYLEDEIRKYSDFFHKINVDKNFASSNELTGNTFFMEDGNILSLPSMEVDSRYPYGSDGFNFWAHASGYMYCNEGLFSTFLKVGEGQEPKIAFFAGFQENNGDYKVISLLQAPLMNNSEVQLERYTVFTKTSVYYITEIKDMRFVIRVFVDLDKKIYFTVNIENLSMDARRIYISSYFNPLIAHDIAENGEQRWFREVEYLFEDNNLGNFIVKTNEAINRTNTVSNYMVLLRSFQGGKSSTLIKHEETTSRYQYVGGNMSSLHTPKALKNGTFGTKCHICTFTEVGIAGDILNLEIGGKDYGRCDISLKSFINCTDNKAVEIYKKNKLVTEQVDSILLDLNASELKNGEQLSCSVQKEKEGLIRNNIFNGFFEHLKKQVEFCSLIKGYVQLFSGSLIGIRDVFQATEALLIWQPEVAREKMLEGLNFIDPSGRCPRQYTLPKSENEIPIMDLRAFIDQGVWVISAIISYLRHTQDFEFLCQECGYYEIIDEKKNIVKKSLIKDSVLDHMIRIMEYLIQNIDEEDTKCVRVLYGDWNDALDGLGVSEDSEKEFGSGATVMVSLQVFQNLNEMIELLNRVNYKNSIALISKYKKVKGELKEGLEKYAIIEASDGDRRIVHGWGDKRSYYVGSFSDSDNKSRYSLTSNSFWVLSKMYDEDMSIKDTILEAYRKLDSKYGLKTFEPYFAPNTLGVGRIPRLHSGTAENGAAYIHASAFGIMSLFRMGCPREAWEQLYKSLPFTHEYVSCSSFVMPNSYGYNEEKNIDGQSMLDWQTGSSNIIFKVFIKYVFGISPEFDGVWVQPCNWTPFEGFELNIKIRTCSIKLSHRNTNSKERIFTVNGVCRSGIYDPVMMLTKLWLQNEELLNEVLEIDVID